MPYPTDLNSSSGIYDIRISGLEALHSGKVRESFRLDRDHRLLVVTDRVSCFDRVLATPVPDKGSVLNGIAEYWFRKTADICPNHFVRAVDPAVSIVREASPLPMEVIVRGYLTGSAWRAYREGRRELSGVRLPDGLDQNQALKQPILTPTTKEEVDREISPAEMIETGLLSAGQWRTISTLALRLFERGRVELARRNLLLVDTKYEFGIIGDELILIDEVHTPDSSRFWYADSYDADPIGVKPLDKEFVRRWLLDNPLPDGSLPSALPPDVLVEARRRYLEIFRLITGKELHVASHLDPGQRIEHNLRRAGILYDGVIAVSMGSQDATPASQRDPGGRRGKEDRCIE